ncbi:hypothetical protein [Streptomyces formicae]|uniref:DNA-binding protein n=1 Tax=Streptomyces formicae TaxID=1616117 RepID=A0A291Q163_9ACTN|nr:hypothetical protein [Streptomyces formicae]ATL25234.1 hypothetical protein KY5_0216c [Streptomyces formicae]
MTTPNQLRKAALALPETEEGIRDGEVFFTVRGKRFASLTKDGVVRLRLAEAAAESAAAAHLTGERLLRGDTVTGFRVPLADIGGKDLNALARAAWADRAPRRLVAELDAADAGAGGPRSDLPPGIGKPATRALLGAGLTTLSALTERTGAELLALHGVGPKAVRILSEELERRGLALRD